MHKVRRQRLRQLTILLALLLFPVTLYYFSPALPFQGASEGVLNGSLIIFAVLFLSALVLGRSYCAWACPGAGLMEPLFAVNARPAPARLRWLQWTIWVVWAGGLAAMVWANGGYRRVDFFYQTEGGLSLTPTIPYIVYYVVVGLMLTLSIAVGRRGFCHSVCWMAPFMVLGRRLSNALNLPALRLQAEPARCVSCHKCAQNCPMSLDVTAMVQAGRMEAEACILCGTCVDNCAKHAIQYRFSRPTDLLPAAARQTLPR